MCFPCLWWLVNAINLIGLRNGEMMGHWESTLTLGTISGPWDLSLLPVSWMP